MPRRSTSRNLVPGGSFAIAASMAGFYPVDSPGGWNILARTPVQLWDLRREPAALMSAGDRVSFEPISRAEYDELAGKAQAGELRVTPQPHNA